MKNPKGVSTTWYWTFHLSFDCSLRPSNSSNLSNKIAVKATADVDSCTCSDPYPFCWASDLSDLSKEEGADGHCYKSHGSLNRSETLCAGTHAA